MIDRLQRTAPAFLASVSNAGEAAVALAHGAGIIDCKDPARGALGDLDLREIARVVACVGDRAPVSATLGDEPDAAFASAVAATGVDIVKSGFFGTSRDAELAISLARADIGPARLYAVLMADRLSDLSLVPVLAEAGFIGVMLDTADKTAGPLRHVLDEARIGAFLAAARRHGLIAGLAGSLTLDDIAPLGLLDCDILGFRGALCASGRTSALDGARVTRVGQELDRVRALRRAREKSVA